MTLAPTYPRTFPLSPSLPEWARPRAARRLIGKQLLDWAVGKLTVAKAVTGTLLTASSGTQGDTNATVYVTGSASPSANKLQVVFVHGRNNFISPSSVSSITGQGITWTQVTSATVTYSTNWRDSAYVGTNASPTTGSLTITWANTLTNCAWVEAEFDGVDLSGGASAACINAATNTAIPGTSLTVTLGAFSSVNNGVIAGFASTAANTITEEAGFTAIGTGTTTNLASSLLLEFLASNDTSPSATFSVSDDVGGVAFEVKAAAVAVVLPPVIRTVMQAVMRTVTR